MINNRNKTVGIVLGIFALVIVTTAASFAFFTYSRTGTTTTTVTSGDIEFSFIEGDSASLANAFPVSDSVGAQDSTEEYSFTVNMKSSSSANKMNYDVYLMDANDATGVNYFLNEQIKFALVKNGTYVAETSSSAGKRLSDINGFVTGTSEGEGLVLQDQEITSNVTDTYKLRIWISDDVNYSNTVDGQDNQISTGKYNGYKYSLKVKVTSGVGDGNGSITVNNLTMTTEISDPSGLDAYAVTTSSTAPSADSSEWIKITDGTAKSNVVRTANVTSKTISFMVRKNGKHYLHVKNNLGEVKSESFVAKATGEVGTTKIMNLAATNTNELRIHTHEAIGNQNFTSTEYRYWGYSPNNHVWFNNELWRILGVMDVDNGSGKVEKRLKIMRKNTIGDLPWDLSDSSVNQGAGVNEWSQSDMMNTLNGDYYNRTNSYASYGLTPESRELIGDAKWYLGAHTTAKVTTDQMYEYERGNATGKQCTQNNEYCSDTVERKATWVGKVGLMYATDYGYSSDMSSCSSTNLYNYNESCNRSSWIANGEINQWTMTPAADSQYATDSLYIQLYGQICGYYANSSMVTLPTVYLNANVKILDGDGTTEKPFILSK